MTASPAPRLSQAEYEKQQNFRRFNARILEPTSMALMLIGILALCQPWVQVVHQYSVLVMLAGLIGFNVAVHIPPPDKPSLDEADAPGGQHG